MLISRTSIPVTLTMVNNYDKFLLLNKFIERKQ